MKPADQDPLCFPSSFKSTVLIEMELLNLLENRCECAILQVYMYSIPGVFAQGAKHPLLDYLSFFNNHLLDFLRIYANPSLRRGRFLRTCIKICNNDFG